MSIIIFQICYKNKMTLKTIIGQIFDKYYGTPTISPRQMRPDNYANQQMRPKSAH